MAKVIRQVRCVDTGEAIGDYRWLLESDLVDAEGSTLVVVQMNPSTASITKSDSTVGKVEHWARSNDFGRVLFTNLFAIRTPYQHQIVELSDNTYERAVGPENDRWLLEAARQGTVVAAWGKPDSSLIHWVDRRANEVVDLIGSKRLMIVGSLSGGRWPRHGRGWNFQPRLGPWSSAAQGND